MQRLVGGTDEHVPALQFGAKGTGRKQVDKRANFLPAGVGLELVPIESCEEDAGEVFTLLERLKESDEGFSLLEGLAAADGEITGWRQEGGYVV